MFPIDVGGWLFGGGGGGADNRELGGGGTPTMRKDTILQNTVQISIFLSVASTHMCCLDRHTEVMTYSRLLLQQICLLKVCAV